MAAFISKKNSLLIFIGALCTAALTVLLLQYLLSGPKLGPHYDFLLGCRSDPPIAREFLLIDTDDIMEPGTAAQVLLTLIEMDAETLVIETPVLGAAAGRISSEEEIRYRFDEEFTLLGRNIQNLFEAIRVGSVPPQESEKYVGELVELSLRGKDRLTSALVHKDEAGMVRMEQAAAAFGKVRKAGDLRLSMALDTPWYSKPLPDWDGKLRRISPVLSGTEHVVYAALKGREETIIPLDRSGAILIEPPRNGAAFRRIPLELFLKYEELDHALERLLREADSRGIYSEIEPENSPVFLFEYALSLRDDILEFPGGGKKADWVHARSEYFARLEDFLSGPSEAKLAAGYEDLIAAEASADIAQLTGLRDGLIRCFETIRESYQELRDLRLYLKDALDSSFIILGPDFSAGQPENRALSPAEVSVVLANTILGGRAINPGQISSILFWSLLAVVVCLLIISRLEPLAALITGLMLSLLAGTVFSWSFIVSGYWIDPLIPLTGSLAGTLFVFSVSQGVRSRFARHFRLAYGPSVSKACLKQLIRTGRPLTSELINSRVVVIAVRKPELLAQEDRGNPLAGAEAVYAFREEVSRFFKKAGGAIVGCDGDLVLGCFGSPLERIALGGMKAAPSSGADPYAYYTQIPAVRASSFIAEVLAGTATADTATDTTSWHFGIDIGECSFRYLPISGYSAFGRPVVRARILSSLAPRYNVQVVVSAAVSESLSDMPVRRLNVLKEQDGSGGEAFYQLVMK
ncbi:hypothetical protein FACS1894110_23710 [Spirochaetia bacterium]|nr:hypothetical protein FACS1894110_23710 [Spirochaetia bacterium]